jgi:hypothetical protein
MQFNRYCECKQHIVSSHSGYLFECKECDYHTNFDKHWRGHCDSIKHQTKLGNVYTVDNTVIRTSYPIPFFPKYQISFPESYCGNSNMTGILIRNHKNTIIKPRGEGKDMYWVLKNPNSQHPNYQDFYDKFVIGKKSQSLYAGQIRKIYETRNSPPLEEEE